MMISDHLFTFAYIGLHLFIVYICIQFVYICLHLFTYVYILYYWLISPPIIYFWLPIILFLLFILLCYVPSELSLLKQSRWFPLEFVKFIFHYFVYLFFVSFLFCQVSCWSNTKWARFTKSCRMCVWHRLFWGQ